VEELRGEVEVSPSAPVMRRLTTRQYTNAVHDLLGDVVVPSQLEPDASVDGLIALGASVTTISPRGVEQYESAAYSVAAQALQDEALRGALVLCTPSDLVDATCAGDTLSRMGLRAFRRPLSEDELSTLVEISGQASSALGDFYSGLEYGVAALLQSPNFLFRPELGDPEGEVGLRPYTDYEMAGRLSFYIWDTLPDAELLDAAAAGLLKEDDALADEVDRLLASPRARGGARNFYAELMHLYDLDHLSKDPTVFAHMSAEVGPSAREETLSLYEHFVFDVRWDYRDIFTTRVTFLDRTLAAIYDVRAPDREGFAITTLPEDGGRRGVLGHASFLAREAHPLSSSATKRGKFVRETVLCHLVPPPPADVDTSIPEPSPDAPTLRDRVAVHLEAEACASCHALLDPIGLGFENFDGIGRWRLRESEVMIDASGDIDGESFNDASQMADVLAGHEDVPGCFTRGLFRYAVGHPEVAGERDQLAWLEDVWAASGYRVGDLMREIALSKAFRYAGEPEEGR